METTSYPPINNLTDLAKLRIACGWRGFGGIEDEQFKQYIIRRCQEMDCSPDNAMDYLPDNWGGDEKAFHLKSNGEDIWF